MCSVTGPASLARGLTTAKTNMIGLVIPSVRDSFFPSVTDAIETHLAKEGYNVILSNTGADSSIEQKKIEDLLAWRVDGLIIAPSQETQDASFFWQVWRSGVPFVLIDRYFPDTPFYSVTTDDYAGAAMAVEHLLSIGRRRIACIGGPLTVSANKLRHDGYVETLISHSILPDPNLFATSSAGDGAQAARHLIERKPRPDALFCFNDRAAVDAISVCLEMGIRIPEDLAIVGYADLEHSHILKVPLTTVRQPRNLLGKHASEMLLKLIAGDTPDPAQHKLPVELVVRDSTSGRSR